ncbi:M20 family metallopeptidase [Acuticoccus mangrovi]|uniref:M20 family metallopeptidase n=1 Tax=Acuticoccus mangrovi TaxID=2796142 RepID=A0A934IMJ1_9HYPH|nr:M20 family metallopeptidase [Acuticoccus mangrovi]MBJ3776582.1 M20 family metallopeptidase [Acuticoccus mangrovi]
MSPDAPALSDLPPLAVKAAAEVSARAEALIAFLGTLVDHDSPTEDRALTELVGDLLAAKAEALGAETSRDPQDRFADNRIARWRGGAAPDTPKVLLVGHFDTVYAAGATAQRPFTNRDGIITGPGCYDMKGGLAIGLFAIEALAAAAGGRPPLDITFIFNSDEEIGSPASREVILREAADHDLALVLEPGRPGPALTMTRKGVGIFELEVEGREAHAGAEPEKGLNAIVELARKTLEIAALNDLAAGTSVTPGVVEGGTKPYVVPGRARLSIDTRVPNAAEQARVEAGLAAAAAEGFAPGVTAKLSGRFHRPPMECSDAARAFLEVYRRTASALGYEIGAAESGGASDGNLTAAAGVPTLDGLGAQGGRAHSDEEYVETPSLEMKAQALAGFLAMLASPPSAV